MLQAIGITKSFGPNEVLKGVDFNVCPGEVHALLGENGAGKTTLLRILTGRYLSTGGRIECRGSEYDTLTPALAHSLGIEIVPQMVELIDDLSIADNIFLGRWPTRGLMIDRRAMLTRSAEVLSQVGVQLDPQMMVGDLSYVEKQMVEIARIHQFDPRIIILDEPTAALSVREIGILFGLIRELRSRGLGFIYVSHYLQEVMQISDRITILRDGHVAAAGATSEFSVDSIVHHMVGDIENLYTEHTQQPGEVLFALEHAQTDLIEDLSFELREGEILGIAAPKGEGVSEMFRALCRISGRLRAGSVRLRGRPITVRSSAHALAQGLGYLSEDRQSWGLIHGRSVRENLTTNTLSELASGVGVLPLARERTLAAELVDQFQVSTPSNEAEIDILSGGNQQKALLARLFNADLPVYIIDDPTLGVDVGSKAQIHRLVAEQVARGAGVIMHSSDLDELVQMSDRLLVIKQGRIDRDFSRGEIELAALEKILEA